MDGKEVTELKASMKSGARSRTCFYLVLAGKLDGYLWRSPLGPEILETTGSEPRPVRLLEPSPPSSPLDLETQQRSPEPKLHNN